MDRAGDAVERAVAARPGEIDDPVEEPGLWSALAITALLALLVGGVLFAALVAVAAAGAAGGCGGG
jgi:hypothetical protein